MEQVVPKLDEAKLALLQQAEDSARKAFEKAVKATPFVIKNVMLARKAYDDAQQAVIDYLDEHKSPEEVAAEKEWQAAKAALEVAEMHAKEAMAAYEAILKQNGKTLTKHRSEGDHSRKLQYEDAQAIRQMLAAGKTVKEIKDKYGNSDSSIGYIKNYLQHKLKKGDKAHTPLVNDYYPFGAPYFEEKYKELPDPVKFKVKTFGIAELMADIENKATWPELAAKYGTSERAIMEAAKNAKEQITKKAA